MQTYNAYVKVNNYKIKTQTLEGKKQIIIPVVMLVEGVHNGSAGAILHKAEEFSKYTEAWNGRPATIGHPESNGSYVSANQPTITEANTVGRIYNTTVKDNKLRSEVWLDEEKLKQVSPLAYAYIMQEKPLDVSIGVFSDDENVSGAWNGENYIAVAKNYRPDHLALLPGETGACSWQDGCGIRTNANSLSSIERQIDDYLYGLDSANVDHYLEDVFDDGTFVYVVRDRSNINADRKYYMVNYTVNKDGSLTIDTANPQEVQKQVKYVSIKNNKGGSNVGVTYSGTESVAWNAPALSDFGLSGDWQSLAATDKKKVASCYLIGHADAASFGDLKLPVVNPKNGKLNENALRAVISGRGSQVTGVDASTLSRVRRTAYELLNKEFDAKLKIPTNLIDGGHMKEKVEKLLVAYPSVYHTDEDKAWLEGLTEEVIDKMLAQAEVMQANIDKTKKPTDKDVQVNEETALKLLKEKISDMKVFAELLPAELKRQFEYGQKLYTEHRDILVNHIITNQAVKVWDNEMLNGLDDVTLEKIAQSIKEPASYIGLGDIKDNSSQPQEILFPLNVVKENKKEG